MWALPQPQKPCVLKISYVESNSKFWDEKVCNDVISTDCSIPGDSPHFQCRVEEFRFKYNFMAVAQIIMPLATLAAIIPLITHQPPEMEDTSAE